MSQHSRGVICMARILVLRANASWHVESSSENIVEAASRFKQDTAWIVLIREGAKHS